MSAYKATTKATKDGVVISFNSYPLLFMTPSKQAEEIADREGIMQDIYPTATITTEVVYL